MQKLQCRKGLLQKPQNFTFHLYLLKKPLNDTSTCFITEAAQKSVFPIFDYSFSENLITVSHNYLKSIKLLMKTCMNYHIYITSIWEGIFE